MPAAQIAQLINDESRQVQAEIDRERAAQLNRGGTMRSLTRRKELADAADETKQAVRDRLGSPVVVSERTVRRWRSGEGAERAVVQAAERVAAKLVATKIGIKPDAIRSTESNVKARTTYTPAIVLSLWRDSLTRLDTRRRCPCGCASRPEENRSTRHQRANNGYTGHEA
jgi:hypothetical protein